jgi:hypothetical protein
MMQPSKRLPHGNYSAMYSSHRKTLRMAKKQPRPHVTLRHPQQYIISMVANRYHIDRLEDFTLVQFGLMVPNSGLINIIKVAVPDFTLESMKENLVQYSDQFDEADQIPGWVPPQLTHEDDSWIPVVDFIHVTHWDENAEICLWNFSQGQVADMVNPKANPKGEEATVFPWGVAMIRCKVGLQKAFLDALYE